MQYTYYFILSLLLSTFLYLYLKRKTKINIRYLYIDNPLVAIFAFVVVGLLNQFIGLKPPLTVLFITVLVPGFAFAVTMIRFWRTPNRRVTAKDNEIVSPADGNVIYIKEIRENEVPVSIKKGIKAELNEITKTNIPFSPCWLVGINMTPFDVHKNCAPVSGKIILNEHFKGKFLSLKDPQALKKNERNTIVIDNGRYSIGVVQTASRLVRRIDSYKTKGEFIKKGDWFGMIRFGSQVDVIIPLKFKLNVKFGQQLYAGKTILAIDENPN